MNLPSGIFKEVQVDLDDTAAIESIKRLGTLSLRQKMSAQMAKNIEEIKSQVGVNILVSSSKKQTLWSSLIQPPKNQDYHALQAVLPTGFENSKLLYRWSRDEQSNKAVHLVCDAKGPLIILVQSLNRKFGAYSERGLDSIGGWRKSNNSYLFGITDNVPLLCPILPNQ